MNLQYRKDKGRRAVKKPGLWLLCMLLVIMTAAAGLPAMAAESGVHMRGVKAFAEQSMMPRYGVKSSTAPTSAAADMMFYVRRARR